MKAVIYGIGKRCSEFLPDREFIENEITRKGIEIIGFSDSNETAWGKEVIYGGHTFLVKRMEAFQDMEIDKIIVTTSLYFHEIKEMLTGMNYNPVA